MKKETKINIVTYIGLTIIIILFFILAHRSEQREKQYYQDLTYWQQKATFNAGYINGMKDILFNDSTYHGDNHNFFRSKTPIKIKN